MKTQDMLPVLLGEVEQRTELYATPAEARAARNRASMLLRSLKDRHCYGLGPKYRPPLERLNGVKVYVLPDDPCLLICGLKPEPHIGGPYKRVLSLAVGESCIINVRGTGLDAVKGRLKQLASQVEAEIGTRPCWQAAHGESVLQGPNPFRITRLPDDHDPVTGQERAFPTGHRLQTLKADWARFNELLYAFESARADAGAQGQPAPECPQELLELAARLRPSELPYLKGETENV